MALASARPLSHGLFTVSIASEYVFSCQCYDINATALRSLRSLSCDGSFTGLCSDLVDNCWCTKQVFLKKRGFGLCCLGKPKCVDDDDSSGDSSDDNNGRPPGDSNIPGGLLSEYGDTDAQEIMDTLETASEVDPNDFLEHDGTQSLGDEIDPPGSIDAATKVRNDAISLAQSVLDQFGSTPVVPKELMSEHPTTVTSVADTILLTHYITENKLSEKFQLWRSLEYHDRQLNMKAFWNDRLSSIKYALNAPDELCPPEVKKILANEVALVNQIRDLGQKDKVEQYDFNGFRHPDPKIGYRNIKVNFVGKVNEMPVVYGNVIKAFKVMGDVLRLAQENPEEMGAHMANFFPREDHETVLANYNKIASQIEEITITLVSDLKDEGNYLRASSPADIVKNVMRNSIAGDAFDKHALISVTSKFFLPERNVLSGWTQMNTIIHELSHFTVGTKDHAYTLIRCLELPIWFPEQAVANADSYGIFAQAISLKKNIPTELIEIIQDEHNSAPAGSKPPGSYNLPDEITSVLQDDHNV